MLFVGYIVLKVEIIRDVGGRSEVKYGRGHKGNYCCKNSSERATRAFGGKQKSTL